MLLARLFKAIDKDHAAHREQTLAEREAWEAEQEALAEETAEREAAVAHLEKLNDKYAKLKAPALRKQLAKRGLKTSGKKTQLLEWLADALETEYEKQRETEKRIAAEEAARTGPAPPPGWLEAAAPMVPRSPHEAWSLRPLAFQPVLARNA